MVQDPPGKVATVTSCCVPEANKATLSLYNTSSFADRPLDHSAPAPGLSSHGNKTKNQFRQRT